MRHNWIGDIIRGAVRTRRLVRQGMDGPRRMAVDVKIITAGRLAGARSQQQTGQDRREGDSPVSQRPRSGDLDHVRTNQFELPHVRTITRRQPAKTCFMQDTGRLFITQEKKAVRRFLVAGPFERDKL